jgi:hypothetical protein
VGVESSWVHSTRRRLNGLLYLLRVTMMMGIWWNKDWRGNPKYAEKTCHSATLSTTNLTWTDQGSKPDRRGGKPATNRLSYGAADSVSNRNGYQESSWGVKGGRRKRLTNLAPSVSRSSRENMRASTSHNPIGLHGLLQRQLYLYLYRAVFYTRAHKHTNTSYCLLWVNVCHP